MPKPEWYIMINAEKIEYLGNWCDQLSRSLAEAQNSIQLLHERLQKIEAAAANNA